MAHFAQLDNDDVVIQVVVIKNNELLDENGKESEAKGIAFCKSLYGADTRWIQTSYNGHIRKRFAGIGYIYVAESDGFAEPKPERFPSFVLDRNSLEWVPPVSRPTDTVYYWNERLTEWKLVPQPFPSWTSSGNPLKWVPPIPMPTDGKFYLWDEETKNWILEN